MSTYLMHRHNVQHFHQVSPFSLELSSDGRLFDPFKKNILRFVFWESLLHACACQQKEVMPTIASFSKKDLMWLKYYQSRHNMINVLCMVANKFDGLILNFEQIPTTLVNEYMDFIKELSYKFKRAQKKIAYCVPPSTRNIKILKHLATYGDALYVMCYNQWLFQGFHVKANRGYYVSCAPLYWIELVLSRMARIVPAEKIIMCLPLHGNEFEIISNKRHPIKKLRSLNYYQACAIARTNNCKFQRARGSELYYSYKIQDCHRYVCFTDHVYINQARNLVEKLKLKGVYLFAADGYEDPHILEKIIEGAR